jgi:Zn-finger nucleic acid-binding protein
MKPVECPICQVRIILNEKVEPLDRVSCPSCNALLEVIGTSPLELDWIYYDEYNQSMSTQRSKNPEFAKCPLCRENVHIGSDIKVGSRILCPGCDAQLELVSLIPPELDWPFDDGIDYYSPDEDIYYSEYEN